MLTDRAMDKLGSLPACGPQPCCHAVPSQLPWGSTAPLLTFFTFFMFSITPDVVTLNKTRSQVSGDPEPIVGDSRPRWEPGLPGPSCVLLARSLDRSECKYGGEFLPSRATLRKKKIPHKPDQVVITANINFSLSLQWPHSCQHHGDRTLRKES